MSLLHHEAAPHTPPVEDGFAREDLKTPVTFEVVHGNADNHLAGFVLYATQNQSRSSHGLQVVEDLSEKPLIKH